MKSKIFFAIFFFLYSYSTFSQIVKDTTEIKRAVLRSNYRFVDCGNIFFAYALRFTETTSKRSFIGIIKCPDGYGDNFFKEGLHYKMDVRRVSNLGSTYRGYTLVNPYKGNALHTFQIDKIMETK